MVKNENILSWFMKGLAYNPSAITEEDIDVFASHAELLVECVHNLNIFELSLWMQSKIKNQPRTKITMPVLVLGGDIYPALGGDFPGNFALNSTQALATNVTGITVPLSGHWIPEEQPQFVIEQLAKFFSE